MSKREFAISKKTWRAEMTLAVNEKKATDMMHDDQEK